MDDEAQRIEEGFSLLEGLDRCAVARNQLRKIAPSVAEWAGIPIPMQDENLRVCEGHPLKKLLEKDPEPPPLEPGEEEVRVVNAWFSRRKGFVVFVGHVDGKARWMIDRMRPIDYLVRTASLSPVWGIEQEAAATQTLGGLLKHHQFRCYLMTGTFLETSRRSGVPYIFRRQKPTIALAPERPSSKGKPIRVLAALCLHPIGYYENTAAGAMCPTDDVIAHLMMMRGDEPAFWRRANQHPADVPEAML